MTLKILAMPTELAQTYWDGHPDANQQTPEKLDGGGGPCRHCLSPIDPQKGTLVLAYRPFHCLNPYTETGPIFLCGDTCHRYHPNSGIPPMYSAAPEVMMIVRGYNSESRIQYDAAVVVPARELEKSCIEIVSRPEVAFAHVRYAATNCFQFQVEWE